MSDRVVKLHIVRVKVTGSNPAIAIAIVYLVLFFQMKGKFIISST